MSKAVKIPSNATWHCLFPLLLGACLWMLVPPASFSRWYFVAHYTEVLAVPFFADHIRSLTERFEFRISWCGRSPLSSASRLLPHKLDRGRETCRDYMSKGDHVDTVNLTQPHFSTTLPAGFPVQFSSVVRLDLDDTPRQTWRLHLSASFSARV